MSVCVVPADRGGCGYYRLRWPAQALIEQGYDVLISDDADTQRADDFDVVVLQRPTNARLVAHIPNLQAAGIAVVVEIDDDFSAIPQNNQAWRYFNPRFNQQSNWNHLTQAASMADLVTVSTPALADRYGKHGRVAVLRNYVPKRYLATHADRSMSPIRIGWTGTPLTHPGDLDVVGVGVHDAMAGTDTQFVAIGSSATLDILNVPGESWPWADLLTEYPEQVAKLHVGIVPLADTRFNHAKSWLKGLEYAALGVPFVASPTPEYLELFAKGAGLIADRPRVWKSRLNSLLTNSDERLEQIAYGRATAAQLLIEDHAWRWAEAWEQAAVNRKKRIAA